MPLNKCVFFFNFQKLLLCTKTESSISLRIIIKMNCFALDDDVSSSIQKEILDYSHKRVQIESAKPIAMGVLKAKPKINGNQHEQMKARRHNGEIDIHVFGKEFGEEENAIEYCRNVEATKHTIKRKANDTIDNRYIPLTFVFQFDI